MHGLKWSGNCARRLFWQTIAQQVPGPDSWPCPRQRQLGLLVDHLFSPCGGIPAARRSHEGVEERQEDGGGTHPSEEDTVIRPGGRIGKRFPAG